ncbi:MAG: glutamine--fructose-6-phosphate transaminase (isomerizing), partial [Candidatus Poseidoniales archaeon]
MCGIFAYLGPRQASTVLVDGLRRLEYRGYDSTGIAVKDGTIQIHKKVGKVGDLETILPAKVPGTLGIAHTRWATHGIVNDSNAHPHQSANGKVVIVHNGIIENTRQLRTSLTAQGIELQSDTDSEALAHIIEQELSVDNDPENAVRRTLHIARGTWG